MRIPARVVPFLLLVGAAVAMVVWSVIEAYPVATAVIAAIGGLVWWRVRRNQDGDPVPAARIVRPDDRDAGDQSQPM